MQIIFVDYIDGAGGEFLSYALSQHDEFYKPNVVEKSNRANHNDPITGFLLESRFHNYNKWSDVAEKFVYDLRDQLSTVKQSHIAIPYHSCYHNHNDLLKKVFPDCKIVYIDPDNHHLIAKEILRKVHLKKLELQDIKHVHQNIVNLNSFKRLDFDDFWTLDILLLRKNIQPNLDSRTKLIQHILDNKFQSQQSYNFVIPWTKFFYQIDQIPVWYTKLCSSLNIEPSLTVQEEIIKRNKNNLVQLSSFDLSKILEEKFGFEYTFDNY
jgi:hypothetical protein